VAAANPGLAGHGNSIDSTGAVTFFDAGLVRLPFGMDSASITFGVTGVSGVVGGGPAVPPVGAGGFSSGDIIKLTMTAGGSTGTSGTSVACLMDQLFSSECPNGGMGFGLGPGTLDPITLIVHNGDDLQLNVSVEATANVAAYIAGMGANAGISVDPLYLTLPAGATFDSGITDFLSGSPAGPGSSVSEPASLALFAASLAGLGWIRRRRKAIAG
jgi:hypothetical protein